MKITREWLEEHRACKQGIEWFRQQGETDTIKVIEKLGVGKFSWTNWLITRLLAKDNLGYALFAAEKVLYIYENKYPDDKRPRKAIEAAIKYLKTENKASAEAAAAKAAAAKAAKDAYAAAKAAKDAYAAAAADAGKAAAYAEAYAAAYAAMAYTETMTLDSDVTAKAADMAVYAAIEEMENIKQEIINYGIQLIKKKEV